MYCRLESAGLDLSLRIVTIFFSFGEARLAVVSGTEHLKLYSTASQASGLQRHS